MSTGSGGTADPWAWLGLLKWSLTYTDGTSSENTPSPMSEEDKAFLEMVMKEGIINENDRLKEILKQVTDIMQQWKNEGSCGSTEQEEQVVVLLQELRDIVEQIDYARAFAAMKGLDFVLGCIQERQVMPVSIRLLCLGLIATLCQNNPPVQKEFLELGSIGILSDLFFQEDEASSEEDSNCDPEGQLRARIIQAVSANVRSHELGEAVFCQLDQAVSLLEAGLGVNKNTPIALQKRTLFLLRALLTSDASTRERVRLFQSPICWVADRLVTMSTASAADELLSSLELQEVSLELIQGILEQRKSVNAVLSRKNALTGAGVKRVAAIRGLTGDDLEIAQRELELWESVIFLLARAEPDADVTVQGEASPPMLQDGSDEDKSSLLAQ